MQKILVRSIPNHEAMSKFATQLCEQYLIPAGNFTLCLEGGLGAGKTFLAKEILAQLGVNQEVSSPTYALVNEYEANRSRDQISTPSTDPGICPPTMTFCHWDFYRMEEDNDFFARGFQDLAGQDNTSHLIEWPERLNAEARSCFSGKKFVVTIDFGLGVGMRKVKLLEQ